MIFHDEHTPAPERRSGRDDIELTLRNLEYTIEHYLRTNGTDLDLKTRTLLAGVRDCVGRVALAEHALGRA